ncbi:MAG: alpha/beta hydrolase [candidate division NC10 bacterium]|nr:alpha/beta hydrolase [candidate division NC10 bacterium]
MHVKQYGEGSRDILAIHGWAGDHREFAPLASRLPQGMRLLSVDLPGYGQSPPPARWDLPLITEALGTVIDEATHGDCTLMGFCSGAFLAMLLTRERKQRIGRLLLIDPFAYLPWYFKLFTLGEFGRRAYYLSFASSPGRRMVNGILQNRQPTDGSFTEAFIHVNHQVTLNYLYLFNQFKGLESFRDLDLPIDLAYGVQTFAAVRRSVAYLQQLWPHARVHQLRGVGHLTMVGGARQLAQILSTQIE